MSYGLVLEPATFSTRRGGLELARRNVHVVKLVQLNVGPSRGLIVSRVLISRVNFKSPRDSKSRR